MNPKLQYFHDQLITRDLPKIKFIKLFKLWSQRFRQEQKIENRILKPKYKWTRSQGVKMYQIDMQLGELKKLRSLIEEQTDPEIKNFLEEFANQPYALLDKLGVGYEVSQAFFEVEGKITLDFLMQFKD